MANMENKNRVKFGIGILLIILGILCLLGELHVIRLDNLWGELFSWRTLLIFIGLMVATKHDSMILGFIIVGVGVLFWILEILGIKVGFHQVVVPLIFVFVGLSMVLRRLSLLSGNDHDKKSSNNDTNKTDDGSEYIDV